MHGLAKIAPSASTMHGRLVPLDAMRGVAALIVVAFHFSAHVGGWSPRFGYLAVDLFFVLSGFVIALVYDQRFADGLTIRSFMARRLYRLAPLFLLGWSAGVAALIAFPDPQLLGPRLEVTAAMNFAGLPSPFPASGGTFNLFGVNRPFWSLFFEFWVANLLFAISWRWMRGAAIYSTIAVSALTLVIVEKHFHSLNVGMSPDSLLAGIPRVLFSFFAGVLIARLHGKYRAPYTVPSIVCLAAAAFLLCLPLKGRMGEGYELVCVFALLPTLVYFGASARESFSRASLYLGDLSYAVYTIHFPVLIAFAALAPHIFHTHARLSQAMFVGSIALVALSAAVADERFRRTAYSRFFKRQPALLTTT